MSKIYAIIGAIAGGILAIFIAFGKGAESAQNKIAAKTTKKALKTTAAAAGHIVKGAKKQEEIRNEKVDTDNRNHFS